MATKKSHLWPDSGRHPSLIHYRRPPEVALAPRCGRDRIDRLPAELDELGRLEAAFAREQLVAALERAVQFGRFRAGDVQAIHEAGTGVQRPAHKGEALVVPIGQVRGRSLAEYAPEAFR